MTLPSGFFPLLIATESSPVQKRLAKRVQSVLESGSHPSPFQTPDDWKKQWSVTIWSE